MRWKQFGSSERVGTLALYFKLVALFENAETRDGFFRWLVRRRAIYYGHGGGDEWRME